MSVKKYYLDKRTLKSPTTDGSLANLQNVLDLKDYVISVVDDSTTDFTSINVDTINESTAAHGVIIDGVTLKDGAIILPDNVSISGGSTLGTLIGTSNTQKLGFWNTVPKVQPTTAVASATNVGGAGTTVKVDDTFDGYTIAQVVKALRVIGILA